jgi:hypothetical protein
MELIIIILTIFLAAAGFGIWNLINKLERYEDVIAANTESYIQILNAMKEIDDARSEYENNKEKLKILEEINTYIINMEKTYQKA